MFQNRNLIIIGIIALINSLGYGIIIPILYSYSIRFGLTDFQNGMLFALFSLCQFLATPLIGRLSDKYGRKPLLVISLIGTAISFFMAAWAPWAWVLFVARALDGLTAGNIPVASAVISDTTEPKDRAKGFGIIGASFGFGFVFGPAISALTVDINPALPFIIAGIITVIGVIVTQIFLPETNKHLGEVSHAKLFDFSKMAHALIDPLVGPTFITTLLYSTAFGLFIFAFQPFAVRSLSLEASTVSKIYTLFGFVGLISQILIIPRVIKRLGEKQALTMSFTLIALSFFSYFFVQSLFFFVVVSTLLSFSNSFAMPTLQTILSKQTDPKSQGTIMGLNMSYMSIGNVIGPVLGGFLATYFIPLPFLLGSFLSLICIVLVVKYIKIRTDHLESAF
jgi:MFS family permease